jgi:hypothetical protein
VGTPSPTPTTGDALTASGAEPLAWTDIRRAVDGSELCWLTSLRPDGSPHTRPVLTVWLGDRCFTAANPTTRKARNLAIDPRCSLATSTSDLDVTIEGVVVDIAEDDALLAAVADAYARTHGWPATVDVGAFDAPYGAPTAGPPPYCVLEVEPHRVYAFGTTETLGPRSTRFTF